MNTIKVKIIAREMIKNPHTGNIHTDDGLKALDGYFEDVISVDKNYNELDLVEYYEETYPQINGWNFEVIKL